MDNLISQLNEMRQRIETLMEQLWIARKAEQVAELEKESAAPDFWENSDAAQTTMKRMAKLRNEVEAWQSTHQQILDTLEFAELGDKSLLDEITNEVAKLQKKAEKLAFQAMLSGEHDNEDAILAIHAGAGGVDAQDWAEMLLRMYLRWAESNGHKVEIEYETVGDGAGIKSASISVKGDWAYGYLQAEMGVHRMVRLSPFDSNNRRHTSFALIEAWPDIQQDIEIEINDKDLQIDTFRAGGAGGDRKSVV